MSGDSWTRTEVLEAVLTNHTVEDYSDGEYASDASLLCACSFVARGSDLYDAGHAHRTHVAAMLDAALEEQP